MYLKTVNSIFYSSTKCHFVNVLCNSIAHVRPGIECKVCRMYVHSKCQIYVTYCSGVSIFHYKIFLFWTGIHVHVVTTCCAIISVRSRERLGR